MDAAEGHGGDWPANRGSAEVSLTQLKIEKEASHKTSPKYVSYCENFLLLPCNVDYPLAPRYTYLSRGEARDAEVVVWA